MEPMRNPRHGPSRMTKQLQSILSKNLELEAEELKEALETAAADEKIDTVVVEMFLEQQCGNQVSYTELGKIFKTVVKNTNTLVVLQALLDRYPREKVSEMIRDKFFLGENWASNEEKRDITTMVDIFMAADENTTSGARVVQTLLDRGFMFVGDIAWLEAVVCSAGAHPGDQDLTRRILNKLWMSLDSWDMRCKGR